MNQAPTLPLSMRRTWVLQACSVLAASGLWAQTQPAETSDTPPPKPDDVLTLSPFTVDTTQDKGYFAENTLAGSRLKTNVSDLGASISVITVQQLEDTASVDINDVFRYEINTEGSGTYTPSVLSLRSDGVVDTNAGFTHGGSGSPQTNATSNRVRGIGVPSMAINYYPAISQIPFDSYNVQSIEISRGPNSMLFGMGSPAGIVNQNTAQAVLNRDSGKLQLRWDDRGSTRGSFSFNKGIIDDKLAIYGATLWDERRFERKPSYDNTRRLYGAITYKPFSKTVLRASVENYENHNRRPNTLTPRDYVTQWNLAGRPVYDSLTKTVTKLSTGEVTGPYIINANSPRAQEVIDYVTSRPDFDPALWDASKNTYNGVSIFGEGAATNVNSILYVPGLSWVNQARATMQIADGQLINWFQPLYGQRYRTAWGTATNPAANAPLYPAEADIWANPAWADAYNRDYSVSAAWTATNNGIIGYKYPGVTDKSIYDWENVNINQMNFGFDQNNTFNVELEQELLSNLHLSAGWFRQDFDSFTNYTVSQLNVATLFVDTNVYLPDGSANPMFGQVYVEDFEPDRFVNAERDDHYRAMLAYTPDFTNKDGWLKWLGRHQILGLWSRQETEREFYRQRLHYVDAASDAGKFRYFSNHNNNADGTPTGWSYQTTGVRRAYYLSGSGDPHGAVTRGSGEWNPLTYTGDITVYDYANSQFDTVNMTQSFITHNASTSRSQRRIDSLAAGMTNYFWDDRLVTTFGIRRDEFKARITTQDAIRDRDGNIVEPALTNAEKWVNGEYQVDRVFNRWNMWDELSGNTSTMGGVLRPFRHWSGIENRAASGSLFWQFVHDFGVSYNKSDNFNAPDTAQVDVFGTALPKPTGEGEDYGIQFSLFDNKLFARVTWFEATNENERTNPGSSISRLTDNVDTTLFRNWARTIAMINMGMDPTAEGFGSNLTPAEEDAVQAAAEEIWQLPYTYYQSLPGAIGATRNAKAEGVEAQVTYNPTPNWTMKFTFGKQDTVYTGVLTQFDAWHAVRDPVWQGAQAADYLLPQYQERSTYTTAGGREVDLTNFWTSYGFHSAVRLDEPNGNTSVERYYANVVTPQYILARDLDGQSAPGQRKYRWSFLTNYAFDNDLLKGWSVGGSQRWEDKAVIGYYGRASGANGTSLDVSDTNRPIYDSTNAYTDLWVGYTRKILENKVRMKLQLNVVNVFEDGGLQATAVNYDGTPYAFRIIDPRQFIFTAGFDF